MINIIDTSQQVKTLFDNGKFNIKKWKNYINSIYPDCAQIFLDEVSEYTASGKYSFEKDFLPIIENVFENECFSELCRSFAAVTDKLQERITANFGKALDIDIVLYLGLCNGAGWVTNIAGHDTIMLGIEKILELGWQTLDSMQGLVFHELGHVFHIQHGAFEQETTTNSELYIHQLFTEGIAMYFEQVLVGDTSYYHQDKNGWKTWCDKHFIQIIHDFDADLPSMTQFDQRYFGDWANYCGKGDVGYYLGARFVHHLLEKYDFNKLIKLDIGKVCSEYAAFVKACGE